MSQGRAVLRLDIIDSSTDVVIGIHDSVCVNLHERLFLIAHFKSLQLSIDVEMGERILAIFSRRASTSGYIPRNFLSKLRPIG